MSFFTGIDWRGCASCELSQLSFHFPNFLRPSRDDRALAFQARPSSFFVPGDFNIIFSVWTDTRLDMRVSDAEETFPLHNPYTATLRSLIDVNEHMPKFVDGRSTVHHGLPEEQNGHRLRLVTQPLARALSQPYRRLRRRRCLRRRRRLSISLCLTLLHTTFDASPGIVLLLEAWKGPRKEGREGGKRISSACT